MFSFKGGYQYPTNNQDFRWFLGNAGDSCDTTCSNLLLINAAAAAMSLITTGDCNMIDHFRTSLSLSYTQNTYTAYWTFGYFYTNYQTYYCTSYGTLDAAVNVGHTNIYSTRRLVCPCSGIIKALYTI